MAIPEAWVVRCKRCSCVVTCFATDPQAEHLATKKPEPPYRSEPQRPRGDGALVVAASVVAAIRLRGEDVKPSPKLKAVIHDSLRLVRLQMPEIQK